MVIKRGSMEEEAAQSSPGDMKEAGKSPTLHLAVRLNQSYFIGFITEFNEGNNSILASVKAALTGILTL